MNILSLKDLYNYKEKNYAWESFNYPVSKVYFHNQGKKNSKHKNLFRTKDHYLDKIVEGKKNNPGPSQYNPSQIKFNTKTGKINQRERLTLMTEIGKQNRKEDIPGPGTYFRRAKSTGKIKKAESYQSDENEKTDLVRINIFDEIQYAASQTPGVGSYNISIKKSISGPRIMKQKKKLIISQKPPSELNLMQSTPGTFENLKIRNNRSFTSTTVNQKHQRQEAKKPSATSYQLNYSWNDKKSLLKIVSRGKSRSVYYH